MFNSFPGCFRNGNDANNGYGTVVLWNYSCYLICSSTGRICVLIDCLYWLIVEFTGFSHLINVKKRKKERKKKKWADAVMEN